MTVDPANQLSSLQVMLAQAINQQDRNAAAQLRETLRCLSLFDQVNYGLGVTGKLYICLRLFPERDFAFVKPICFSLYEER